MRVKKSPTWTAILVFTACVLAFFIRLFPYDAIFRDGRVYFIADDCPYHMRRIMLTIQHFPQVPVFDSYMAYPDGANCIWPPLFDFFIALLALLVGIGHPSERMVEILASFVPPVLGALTLLPTYLLGKTLAGRAVGVGAAFLMAVLPGQVLCSIVGRVDHHVAETLLLVCTTWMLVLACAGGAASARVSHLVLAGILLGGLFLVQSAAIIYAVTLLLGILAYCAANPEEETGTPFCRKAALPFVIAAAIILPFAATAPKEASPDTPYLGLSWLQVALLCVAAVSLFMVSVLAELGLWRGWRRVFNLGIISAGAMGGLLGMGTLFPALGATIRAGLEFLWKSDPFWRTVSELSPVFASSTNSCIVWLIRGICYVMPAGVLLLLLLAPPRGSARLTSPRIFYLATTLALVLLVLPQVRYVFIVGPNVSIVLAYLLVGLPRETGLNSRWQMWLGVFIALGMCLFLVVPACRFYARAQPSDLYPMLSDEVYDGLLWLRTHSNTTSFYLNPWQRPEYSVLCDWDKGHLVKYYARRPVVVDNFGPAASRSGVEDSTRFMIAESEDEAVRIAQRRGIRYVLAMPPIRTIHAYCVLGQLDLGRYIVIGPKGFMRAKPNFYNLLIVRLHEGDGGSIRIPGTHIYTQRLEHFRLVYESPVGKPDENGLCNTKLKIFEFVPGAKLNGRGMPNQEVVAQVHLTTNQGRRIEYRAIGVCASDGHFTLVIPYTTQGAHLTVTCAHLSGQISITEPDVQQGKEILVKLSSAQGTQ